MEEGKTTGREFCSMPPQSQRNLEQVTQHLTLIGANDLNDLNPSDKERNGLQSSHTVFVCTHQKNKLLVVRFFFQRRWEDPTRCPFKEEVKTQHFSTHLIFNDVKLPD